MDIHELLRNGYEIGPILEIRDMSKSNRCYLVVTDEMSYVFKHAGRLDFIKIYDKVQNVLNQKGLIHGKVILAKNESLMSLNGFSLLEYIPGDALEKYNDEQFWSIIKYLNEYNGTLREVPFLPQEIEEVNNWDKARSVSFMCNNVESIINQCGLDSRTQFLLRNARKILSDHIDYFSSNQKQLIHADLGPGNIVFCDNKVQTIIDFIPEYEHELYSLSQFLYWTCLWDFHEPNSLSRISSSLKVYYGNHNDDRQEKGSEVLFIYLLKACLFRTIGPILDMIENGVIDIRKVKSRIVAMEALFDIRRDI